MRIVERILHPVDTIRRMWWLFLHARPVYKSWCIKKAVLSMEDKDAFRDEVDFLRREGIYTAMPFPYPTVRRGISTCDVRYDEVADLPYVDTGDGNLYFPKQQSADRIAAQYLSYINDEGITGSGRRLKSPHSYVTAGFGVEQGDVLLDVGCAEALFTLHNIEKVSHAYVFEVLPMWAGPLRATFAPWQDKVSVISKCVSSHTKGDCIRLQDAVRADESATYFIKMDIEGAERDVLLASKDFLMGHRVKLSCCVYHRHDDAKVILNMLKEMGFRLSYSEGYMLVQMGEVAHPYFRHGVIYAQNF